MDKKLNSETIETYKNTLRSLQRRGFFGLIDTLRNFTRREFNMYSKANRAFDELNENIQNKCRFTLRDAK